ncbi:hypothetical protein Vafri_12719 [Volvox africanus]|uniref:Uncharacterized protein n=1 Tax=Volvox africanus TaxID=51714 RepID=A0A8J4F5N9_9CHLO|nr:hypothetical protein Vafri_12719 [Volvox africanus]
MGLRTDTSLPPQPPLPSGGAAAAVSGVAVVHIGASSGCRFLSSFSASPATGSGRDPDPELGSRSGFRFCCTCGVGPGRRSSNPAGGMAANITARSSVLCIALGESSTRTPGWLATYCSKWASQTAVLEGRWCEWAVGRLLFCWFSDDSGRCVS